MILYLSSTQNTNLLDFTGWHDSESETPIKKLVGSYMLKQFVIYDMRNFSHFTDVVLDRLAFGDSDTEFAQAIEEFLTMYNARVTVICEGLSQSDPLFTALLDSGVGNIVCDTEIRAIQQEITECLSEHGMSRYNPKERKKKAEGIKQYCFDCQNVHIAFVGSQPRIGTTTAAIGFCTWLKSVGATVCYVEANTSGHLAILARSYEMEQTQSGWQFEGVQYRRQTPEETINFIVSDLGSTLPQELLSKADLTVLVCGTKPYELGASIRLQKRIEATHAYLLCPFVQEASRDDLAQALQNDYHKVLFLAYQPEPTNGSVNAKQYKIMIADYIAGA